MGQWRSVLFHVTIPPLVTIPIGLPFSKNPVIKYLRTPDPPGRSPGGSRPLAKYAEKVDP